MCAERARSSSHVPGYSGEDRATAVLATDIDTDSLTAFVKSEKMPPTIEFNQKNSDKIFNSGINKQLILWTTADDLKADAEVRARLLWGGSGGRG